jgi:sugar phosphate isomerase/epimerase
MSLIKRGVSLYSFQEEYFLRQMSLEDCIATCAADGAPGVETIAEQMMPGFPELPESFYETWHKWMAKYKTVPTCHDMFLDTKLYKDRLLTTEEMVASLTKDIIHAHRLGCFCIRIIVITPPEVMELCAPVAEKYGIKLLLEIHSPWHFDHEWIQKHVAVMHRTASPALGLLPDLGIFVKSFPQIITDRYIRNGASPKLAAHAVAAYNDHGDLSGLPAEIKNMGGNAEDIALAHTVGHYVYVPPKRMADFLPLIHHIHGKFYDMTAEDNEPSIPYAEIVEVLKQGSYDGYISSEYEGNRHIQDAFAVDSRGQVQRHQRMLKRLIEGDTHVR